jgi:hypothetical protein
LSVELYNMCSFWAGDDTSIEYDDGTTIKNW